MHDVKIDEDKIFAAMDAVTAAPVARVPAVITQDQGGAPDLDGWLMPCRFAASFLAHKVCPAWGVPEDVQAQWAEALAECANDLMPGGLANIEAWGPWGKLAFASGLWVMAGLDLQTMKLKPLHEVTAQDQDQGGDQGPTFKMPQGGGFKTDA